MSYAERKNKLSKADIAAQSKWAATNSPASARIEKVSQERRRLWSALNDYVAHHGGFVTSPPFSSTLRVEVAKDSTLPARLQEFGYSPRHVGSTMRTTGTGLLQTDVIEFDLPR